MSREEEIGVIANAIGYIMSGGDPNREMVVEAPSGQISMIRQAAERAWTQLRDYRISVGQTTPEAKDKKFSPCPNCGSPAFPSDALCQTCGQDLSLTWSKG